MSWKPMAKYLTGLVVTVIGLSSFNLQCKCKQEYSFLVNGGNGVETARSLLDGAWKKLWIMGARRDYRVETLLEDIADTNKDGKISDEEAAQAINVVLNEQSPVGKLWFEPHLDKHVSEDRILQAFDRLSQYRRWEPVISYLVDTSGDGVISQTEREDAARKVLYR